MKFIVSEREFAGAYRVMQLGPKARVVALFPVKNENSLGMAHDYCSFLNNKYCDKNINEEWPKPNNKQRLKYHSEQLMLLLSGRKVKWSEDGDSIREV